MATVNSAPKVVGAPLSSQPRQLIVSLYGLYARENADWLSISSVVRLMAELGVDDQAVRSSISRLKRRELLVPAKVGGVAGYRLSESCKEILSDGDTRIFGRRRATAGDGWLLVVFSVPEDQRARRHQLRSRLTQLGFGTVAPGVWVAPGHLEAETHEMLDRLGMRDFASVFRGQHVGFGDLSDNVRTWWDLAGLRDLYRAFLTQYATMLERWGGETAAPREAAFADYVELVTAWRQLPYADPGLPLEVLPADWDGLAAERLFADLRNRLAGPAGAYARAVLAEQAPN